MSHGVLLPLMFSVLFRLPMAGLTGLFFTGVDFTIPPGSLSLRSVFGSIALFIGLLCGPSASALGKVLGHRAGPGSIFGFPVGVLRKVRLCTVSFQFRGGIIIDLTSVNGLPGPLLTCGITFAISFFPPSVWF